ncbi:peptidylprolyl isomerase [Corynebacterium sp. 153RC1]|uniref:peptidylprolyl isomerase n=1 Tax=Corynebacterium TaxID=1716 RepID=UPI00211B7D33|nr:MULTISPECIES: peptidylprolyl isomerase [unclassified Corynebacterium]MCQ9369660.1 peptidylprolyl isomerase [Corynebacterium sp. 35RC1]MCQ9342517.1 peptidylprolyl isomerase [Corynebacterium sp. 76QC2CO]MCQ9351494.1 peptidylprolyl isomerase [Corynebacterium sp. 209RC1]MCQ9354623.1 peptidylprolyl isomerase [Corynebacterium sp. 1222RC1]MCQ9357525.1 peptidylprolyl isomerase [Corynebacterium sp. 122RC1]
MSANSERLEEGLRDLDKQIKSRDRAEKTKPLGVIAAAAVAILAIVGGIYYATTYTNNDEQTQAAETAAESTAATPEYQPLALTRETPLANTVTCEYTATEEETGGDAPDLPSTSNISTSGTVDITLETSQGTIGMELDRSVSPCTVNAIESLVEQGYYDDTVCHRLTTSGIYVLQCGDPTGTGSGGPGFQFANEYPTDEATDTNTPVIYSRGTIAMANAGADTNGSQFFLNYQDSPLPPNYTYFGQIDEEGLATLDAIAAAGAEGGATDGAPAEEVRIESATVAS